MNQEITEEAEVLEETTDLEKFQGRSVPESKNLVPVQGDGFLAVVERLSIMPDIPVEKIQQLMDMQEKALDRAAKQAFSAAMSHTQAKIPEVPKDKWNDHTRSHYSSYEMILKHVKPVYTAEGFAVSTYEGAQSREDIKFPEIPAGSYRTFADVMHEGGWTKTYYVDVPTDDKGPGGKRNKTDTHAKKSSLSYGKGILMCMIFNIPTGDSDDGNAAGGDKQEKKNDGKIVEMSKKQWDFIAEIGEKESLSEKETISLVKWVAGSLKVSPRHHKVAKALLPQEKFQAEILKYNEFLNKQKGGEG